MLALAAGEIAATCPPPARLLRAIRESTQVRMYRLGGRADRRPNPLDESRLLGFEILESSELSPEVAKVLSRVFGKPGSYACDQERAASDKELPPVQVGFEFSSTRGRVRTVLYQPEQRLELEPVGGVGALLDLSSDGSDAWWNAMVSTLEPLTRPRDFYTFMRAPADSALGVSDTLGAGPETAIELPLEALVRVPPEYPALARSAGVDGIVSVRALVGPDGRVHRTEVTKGDAMLDRAAIDAVQRWRFKPGTANGQAIWAWTTVPVRFSLQ